MRILVLNGSPKGDKSNTMYITRAFVQGMNDACENTVETVNLIDKDIRYCRGCFSCFNDPDGRCAIRDDMDAITESIRNADVVIYSTPVHTFGVSAPMKTLMDRCLTLHKPQINDRDDEGEIHMFRYNAEKQKTVLIATCGFYCYENNVEALVKQFDIMRGDGYEKIICAEGTMFRLNLEDVRIRTRPYLEAARRAGTELVRNGTVSEQTREALTKRHFARREYHQLANNYWNIREEGLSEEEEFRRQALRFIHQMAAMYEPVKTAEGKSVLEVRFADADVRAQLLFTAEGCETEDDPERFLPYSILLNTNYKQLREHAFSRKKMNGGSQTTTSMQMMAEKTIALKKRGISRELKL